MSQIYHSRRVASNQEGIHPDLAQLVSKHRQGGYRRPLAAHTVQVFQDVAERVAADGRPLIFDSGCGVGESTRKIASQHPDCLVLGLDKSAYRLQKNPRYTDKLAERTADNLLLLRVDCVDFWRLAVAARWQLHKHYLLYPNPWPKKAHIQRRWHGHPVWPALLALGGELELRSNWSIYIEEFARALELSDCTVTEQAVWQPTDYLTPFERKYALSGQSLYRLRAALALD